MARFCAEKWRPVNDFARYILQNRRRFSAQNLAVFRIAAATRQRPTHTRLPKAPAPSHQNRRRFSAQNVALFRIAAATRQRPTHTRLPKPPAPSHDSSLPSHSPNAKIVRPALAHAKSVAARLHHRISNTNTCFTKFTRRDNIRICPWGRSERADMSIIELALSTMCGWCVFSVVSFCIVCSTMRDIRGCQF